MIVKKLSQSGFCGLQKPFKLMTLSLAAVFMTACSQVPQYQPPEADLPQQVKTSGQFKLQLLENEPQFWQQFSRGSADRQVLQGLIAEALLHNYQLANAKLNLQQARSLLTQAQARQYPQLNLQATAGLTQSSNQSYPFGQGAQFGQLSLAGLLSYELDIWGKNAALEQRNMANVDAVIADNQALMLTVKAAVVEAYLNLQALDEQISIAEQTVKLRQQSLKLRDAQLEYGSVSALAVYQAKAELSAVQATLAQLKTSRSLQQNAMALLLGRTPQQIAKMELLTAQVSDKPKQALPVKAMFKMPSLLPSEVLQRRPDIKAAEARLIAANANIGVAKAELFPSLSLTGLLGFQSEALDKLIQEDAIAWNGQLSSTAPIFDGGSRQAGVEISQAQQQAALNNYQQTLSQAFAEVYDGLNKLSGVYQQIGYQQQQLTQLRKALSLAQARYDSGYSSYIELLDTERSLLNAELALVNLKLSYQVAGITLYKALGGSWQ